MLLNGVRMATTVQPMGMGAKCEALPVSLRESLHRVSDPRSLDESVAEVFQMMLGLECQREPGSEDKEEESLTAVVGFGGLLSGACVISMGRSVSIEIAALMTGMKIDEVDDTVKDGIGELCNMVAGAWKGKVPELAANCGLSLPAVITGRDYRLHVQSPEFQLHHRYGFAASHFSVTIVCDGLQ